MKELQKYRVIRAYGPYRVGDIIQPTGMLRDELRACGRIEKYEELPAEPAPPVEPEPIDDISDDEDDVLADAAVETAAVAPEQIAARRPGRPRRFSR